MYRKGLECIGVDPGKRQVTIRVHGASVDVPYVPRHGDVIEDGVPGHHRAYPVDESVQRNRLALGTPYVISRPCGAAERRPDGIGGVARVVGVACTSPMARAREPIVGAIGMA